jgi:hypothetical protein
MSAVFFKLPFESRVLLTYIIDTIHDSTSRIMVVIKGRNVIVKIHFGPKIIVLFQSKTLYGFQHGLATVVAFTMISMTRIVSQNTLQDVMEVAFGLNEIVDDLPIVSVTPLYVVIEFV